MIRVMPIIVATAILHNMCLRHADVDPSSTEEIDEGQVPCLPTSTGHDECGTREMLIHLYFNKM